MNSKKKIARLYLPQKNYYIIFLLNVDYINL